MRPTLPVPTLGRLPRYQVGQQCGEQIGQIGEAYHVVALAAGCFPLNGLDQILRKSATGPVNGHATDEHSYNFV